MAIQIICPECTKEITFKFLGVGDQFKCPHCNLQGIVPESGKSVVLSVSSDNPTETGSGIIATPKDLTPADGGKERFPVVRVLSAILKFVAWIVGAASAVLGMVAISNHDPLAGIGAFALGVLIVIVNLAFAELLLVLLALEENTRKISSQKS